jgi:hypothetical protein
LPKDNIEAANWGQTVIAHGKTTTQFCCANCVRYWFRAGPNCDADAVRTTTPGLNSERQGQSVRVLRELQVICDGRHAALDFKQPHGMKRITRDEARRIAANIAELRSRSSDRV